MRSIVAPEVRLVLVDMTTSVAAFVEAGMTPAQIKKVWTEEPRW